MRQIVRSVATALAVLALLNALALGVAALTGKLPPRGASDGEAASKPALVFNDPEEETSPPHGEPGEEAAPNPTVTLIAPPLEEARAWNYPHWNLSDDYRTLSQGDRGERVRGIQARLIRLGYLDDKADGVYGEKTRRAVAEFQRNNGIFGGDGVATTLTQAVMFNEDCYPASTPMADSFVDHGNLLEWDADIDLPRVTLWMRTESEVPITAFVLGWYALDEDGERVYGDNWYWDWACMEVAEGYATENYIPVAEMPNPERVREFRVCVEEIYYADGSVYSNYDVPWNRVCKAYP